MGMFDKLILDFELPGEFSYLKGYEFQIKCLECNMNTYTISDWGRLIGIGPDGKELNIEYSGTIELEEWSNDNLSSTTKYKHPYQYFLISLIIHNNNLVSMKVEDIHDFGEDMSRQQKIAQEICYKRFENMPESEKKELTPDIVFSAVEEILLFAKRPSMTDRLVVKDIEWKANFYPSGTCVVASNLHSPHYYVYGGNTDSERVAITKELEELLNHGKKPKWLSSLKFEDENLVGDRNIKIIATGPMISGGQEGNWISDPSKEDERRKILQNLLGLQEKLYYVQDSRQVVGNCILWHDKNREGYTCLLEKAEVFTKEQALKIVRNRRTDKAWSKDYIDKKARLMVDCHGMVEEKALKG